MGQLGIIRNKKVFISLCLIALIIALMQSCGSDSKNQNNKDKKSQEIKSKNSKTTEAILTVNVPQFNSDSAYHFIKKQVDFGPRAPNSVAHQNCYLYLKNKLSYYGADVVIQEDTVRRFDGEILNMKNIIGSFNVSKKNRVLLCAHWDSRYVADQDTDRINEPIDGANDGGSGVGVLLEVARNISEASPFIGVDIIFFDVEDQGQSGEQAVDDPYSSYFSWCLGSQYWSQNPHTSNYQARFGILLDMVGGPNAVFIPDYGSDYYASEIVDKVWKNAIENGYMDYFDTNSNENYISLEDYELLDDHIMINQFTQMLGRHIPTIDIIEFDNTNGHTFNQHWHTHQDNMDNIDKETLEAVGQTVLNVIYNE